MATYPNYPQLVETQPEENSGIALDIMESGVIRGSDGYDKNVVRFNVQHFLDAADVDALKAFWDTNRGLFVDFTWDGETGPLTYSMIIQSMQRRWHASGKYFVEVEMMGNPQ